MARPSGYLMSRRAWDDVLRLGQIDLPHVSTVGDVPPGTLRAITNGHRRASAPMARRIAAAANCHPETLFPALSLAMAAEVA